MNIENLTDRDKIRNILFECLSMHYDLSESIIEDISAKNKLEQIEKIVNG